MTFKAQNITAQNTSYHKHHRMCGEQSRGALNMQNTGMQTTFSLTNSAGPWRKVPMSQFSGETISSRDTAWFHESQNEMEKKNPFRFELLVCLMG